ncbi:MAG: hypothetical protein CFH19_00234 [Alphaproteobacteria bacterium MarineAlpha5_Bin9]|nr:MAG: hypothetical protein CFH19_00234 [Alphaproteobacteria bacterium MarineAlpha5_Bin9]|tara:strand:- start:11896 stop:12522 length:627 start_codon:yes stop_codon:yes gene_type:complete
MKINLFIQENSNDSYLLNFLSNSSKHEFIQKNFSKFEKSQNNLIIINKQTNLNDFLKKNKIDINNSKKNICFFIPKNYDQYFVEKNIPKISYPIGYYEFETLIDNFFSINEITYKHLKIINQNFLLNSKNDKKIHLTETEYKIISFLFENKKVNKNQISEQILNQAPDTFSKSVESHLYRLRQKLQNIDKTLTISSIKNNSIVIISKT